MRVLQRIVFVRCVILQSLACATLLAEAKVTYDDHVLPVFQQACLNCHNPDKTKGGLDLSSFSATMKGGSGGKIVEPADPASKLIAVVKQTAEPKMPPEGDKLANEQIDILLKWIEGGLLENQSSSARKPEKPKFAAVTTDPASKPDGPPPMPEHLRLEPPVATGKASAVHALAASPWAPLIAATSQRQVLLHHADTLELIGILPFPEGDPVSLAFTPDGRYLIVGGGIPGKSGVTITFDVTNGSRLLGAGREFDSVLGADIRPGFDLVATGGPSRLLKLWNTETGEMVKSIKKHTDWITALDISPDGVLLASGDRNGGVWVWESETGAEFHTLRAHQAAITAAVFRSDSNLLATASEDGTVRYWEMNGGAEVRKNDAHPGGVTALSLARDGTALTTGRDHAAKLWKPDFNHARDLAGKLPALPTAAAIDHSGKRAFIGDALGVIRVYQTDDGKPLGDIPTNPPRIDERLRMIRQEITAAEQAAAATPEDPAAKKLESLRAALKHWSAAAINTRRLDTAANAAAQAVQLEQLHDEFTAGAAKLGTQAEILARKRAEREILESRTDTTGWSPEARDELAATLAAIDAVIDREAQALRHQEQLFGQTGSRIDSTAAATWTGKAEAEKLRAEYFKALE